MDEDWTRLSSGNRCCPCPSLMRACRHFCLSGDESLENQQFLKHWNTSIKYWQTFFLVSWWSHVALVNIFIVHNCQRISDSSPGQGRLAFCCFHPLSRNFRLCIVCWLNYCSCRVDQTSTHRFLKLFFPNRLIPMILFIDSVRIRAVWIDVFQIQYLIIVHIQMGSVPFLFKKSDNCNSRYLLFTPSCSFWGSSILITFCSFMFESPVMKLLPLIFT